MVWLKNITVEMNYEEVGGNVAKVDGTIQLKFGLGEI